jgi:hypothetical protein
MVRRKYKSVKLHNTMAGKFAPALRMLPEKI